MSAASSGATDGIVPSARSTSSCGSSRARWRRSSATGRWRAEGDGTARLGQRRRANNRRPRHPRPTRAARGELRRDDGHTGRPCPPRSQQCRFSLPLHQRPRSFFKRARTSTGEPTRNRGGSCRMACHSAIACAMACSGWLAIGPCEKHVIMARDPTCPLLSFPVYPRCSARR